MGQHCLKALRALLDLPAFTDIFATTPCIAVLCLQSDFAFLKQPASSRWLAQTARTLIARVQLQKVHLQSVIDKHSLSL